MLSSLSGSISTYFAKPTQSQTDSNQHTQADGPQHALAAPHPASPSAHFPITPEHDTDDTRNAPYTPNSLAGSGNQTMTSLLSAHPHFSVFRESTSHQQLSGRASAADESPLGAQRRNDASDREQGGALPEEEMETLASPRQIKTPPPSQDNSQERANSSSDSSFHLSLDGGDMPSLNFGDHSSLSLSPSGSPAYSPSSVSPSSRASRALCLSPCASPPSGASAYAPHTPSPLAHSSSPHSPSSSSSTSPTRPLSYSQTGSVRLIPDSPPVQRTPARSSSTSISRSQTTFTPSTSSTCTSSRSHSRSHSRSRSSSGDDEEKKKMRSSGPVQRVQFSPLSLCPSPLLNAPTMPPPPPPPPSIEFSPPPHSSTSALESTLIAAGRGGEGLRTRGILRMPRTPGTGRSVRFSASTAERVGVATGGDASDLDTAAAGGGTDGWQEEEQQEEEEQQDEEVEESSPSVHLGSRSRYSVKEDQSVDVDEHRGGQVQGQVKPEEEEDGDRNSSAVKSTLLSRLQQIAPPSPEVSRVFPPSSHSTVIEQEEVEDPSVSSTTTLIAATALSNPQTHSLTQSHMLFDESNPFLHLHSISTTADPSAVQASVTTSSTSTLSNSTSMATSTSASVMLVDASLPVVFEHEGTAAGGEGAGLEFGFGYGFGGDSFAQVSHLREGSSSSNLPRPLRQRLVLEGIEEEEGEGQSVSRRLVQEQEQGIEEGTTIRETETETPRRPSRPVLVATSWPSTSISPTSEPLRASDLSSLASSSSSASASSSSSRAFSHEPTLLPVLTFTGAAVTPTPISPPPSARSISPSPPAYTPQPQPQLETQLASQPSDPPASLTSSTTSALASSSIITGSTQGADGGMSFYRRFMAARASAASSSSSSASGGSGEHDERARGSQSAREEWERLERGEKSSPREREREKGELSSSSSSELQSRLSGKGIESQELVEKEEEEELVVIEGELEGESRYYTPRCAGGGEMEDEESEIRVVQRAGDEEEEDALRDEGEGQSLIHDGLGRGTFLSPIVEVSEPESNANTPFESTAASSHTRRPRSHSRSSAPLPPQPSFAAGLYSSLSSLPAAPPATSSRLPPPATPSRSCTTAAPSTPLSASKIPRPRNPITPSQNPFLLQLARLPGAQTDPSNAGGQKPGHKAASLLSDLFTAQSEQLATSHSQRFILSSLVTNLQNEVEGKERMVENLKRQVEEAREAQGEFEMLAGEWEKRFKALSSSSYPASAASPPDDSISSSSATTSARHERKKLEALEETVQLLADELETRVHEDRSHRRALEAELDRARNETGVRVREKRDLEIRLRHEREVREGVEDRLGRVEVEREVKRREVEVVRAGWEREVRERDGVVGRLREEVEALRALGGGGREGEGRTGRDMETMERELEGRVADALEAATSETHSLKFDLHERDSTLATLRNQLQQQAEEINALRRKVGEERTQTEVVVTELTDALRVKEDDLVRVEEAYGAMQEEVEELFGRIEEGERERDRLIDVLRSTEGRVAQQTEEHATSLSRIADLEDRVSRQGAELKGKDAALDAVRREAEQQRKDAGDVLEKRDRVLAEAEKVRYRVERERDALKKEADKSSEVVNKLRRESADREVKITKLKKRAAELEEDIFGLNIALDAKQQEASHWKRQLTHLKHERDRTATTSLGDSVTSAAPPTVSRTAFAPISATSTSAVRRSTSSTSLSLSKSKPFKTHSITPHPSEKAASRPYRTQAKAEAHRGVGGGRTSIARRTSIATSSATETETETETEPEQEPEEGAIGVFSQDLTLPPADHEKTPSRAPSSSTTAGSKRSSSTSMTAAGVRSRSSASGMGMGLGRRNSNSSLSLQLREKENAPMAVAVAGRRREAVLA
ncbi:hypothetical protein JCM11641_001972 [Rhodosporidiobolus odoratus]